MADIEINRPHSFAPDETRRRIEGVVTALRDKYSLSWEWESETRLAISAMGVSGFIDLRDGEVAVAIDKSFWVPLSDEQLELAVNRALDKGLS
jgi:putative polyhydroxyalkanoate system protein